MASNDKNLKISAKVDLKELNEAIRLVQQLGASGNKTAKSLQGVDLSKLGNTVAKGAASKALLEQKKLFDDLGNSSVKVSEYLTKNMSRAQDELARKLETTNSKLERAVRAQKRWREEIEMSKSMGWDTAHEERKLAAADRGVDRLLGDKGQIQKAQSGLASKSGGMIGNAVQTAKDMLPPQMQQLLGFAGPAVAIGAIVKTIGMLDNNRMKGFDARISLAQADLDVERERQSRVGKYQTAANQGDIAQVGFFRQVQKDPQYSQVISDSVKEEIAKIQAESGVSHRLATALNNPMDNFTNFIGANPEFDAKDRAKALTVYARLQNARTQSIGDIAGKAQEAEQQTASEVAAFNSSKEQLLAWERQFGAPSDTLLAGTKKRIAGGLKYTNMEQLGLGSSIIGAGGRDANNRYGVNAMYEASAGMSTGALPGLVTAGAEIGQDLVGATHGRGFWDPKTREIMGGGLAANVGIASQADMGGLANMITSGVDLAGSASEQNRAMKQRIAGLQTMNNLSTGTNAWQKTVNLSNAVSALGKDGTIYAQEKLAGLKMSDMESYLNHPGKELPASWTGMGITRPALDKYAKSLRSSTVNKWYDQGKNDDLSNILREVKGEAGGDWKEWGRKHIDDEGFAKKAKVLSGYLANDIGGGEDTIAEGAFYDTLGVSTAAHRGMGKGKKGKGDPKEDSLALRGVMAEDGAQVKQLTDSLKVTSDSNKILNEGIRGLNDTIAGKNIFMQKYGKDAGAAMDSFAPTVTKAVPEPMGRGH